MQKHPFWLIILTCFMMLYQIFWLLSVLQLEDELKNQISLSVPIEVIVSVAIVTFFTFSLRALAGSSQWAMRYTIVGIGILSITILTRLIIYTEADYDRQRLPFLIIIITVVCCLAVLPKILRHIHKSTKGENSYDPNP